MEKIREIYDYRDLLWLWTLREIRVRYKQSVLGIAWAILQPLAFTIVFSLVFSVLFDIDTGGIPYPIFAYAALVPWTFFTTSLNFGIPSLVNNMNLVTKIYFPREILPLANISAAFLDFLIAAVIFVGMLLAYRIQPGIEVLWVFPLLITQIILSTAITLIGSAVIVFFRDVRFVIPLLLQIWMYATPIIYPVSRIPDRLRPYYFLNPMVTIIDGYRRVLLLSQTPQLTQLAYGAGISVVLLVFSYTAFKWMEPAFADLI